MKLSRYLMAAAIAALCLTAGPNAKAEEFVSVNTPNGAQGFLFDAPDRPVASVILFAGGHGWLQLDGTDIGWGRSNFLVRTRDMFVSQGFQVAVVDTPDYKDKINAIFRMSPQHGQDIREVAKWLKAKADVPVWAVGTSMGTFSSANAAVSSAGEISGLVMTSSITRSAKRWSIYGDFPKGVINMNLAAVRVPVLVMSHRDDGCKKTPASDADELAAAFANAPKVEVKILSGGDDPISGPCQAKSQHGFLGIEDEAVAAIAAFINGG